MRAPVHQPSDGAGLRARDVRPALLLIGLLLPGAARAGCPPVPYPPGLDLGEAVVTARLEVDADGAVARVLDADGPAPLVDAVRASLGGCALAGPAVVTQQWRFPLPPVNVDGVARAKGSRAPLAGLPLRIGDRPVVTDADGSFALRNVAPGTWPLSVGDPTWRLDAPPLTVPADERVSLELWLSPGEVREDEIVGTWRRPDEVGAVRTVGVQQAKAVPGTLGDPLRALVSEPGLGRTPYDAGWLLVRGGDYDEVGLFLDGVRTPLVYHLGGFTSVLHPEMIEAVRFWPGVFPARYGNATSGAVDVVPRAVGDRARAVGGVNVVFAHAFAETPTPWGGVALAARRSWLDGVLSLVLDPEAASIAPRFWDLQARVDAGGASLTLLALSDAIDAPSFSGDGILEIAQRAASAQAVLPIGPHVELRPWLAWTRRDVTGDVPDNSVAELYPGLRAEASTGPAAPAAASVGLEAQRRSFSLQREGLVRTAPLWTVEPYGGLHIGKAVSGFTEVRLATVVVEGPDAQPVRTGLSPRTGARWRAAPGVEAHLDWARLHQLPPVNLLLGLAEGTYLGLERSDQLELGGRVDRAGITVEGAGWLRRVDGLAELELDGSIGQALGRARGVEGRLSAHRGGFDGSVMLQLTRSQKREAVDDPWGPSPFESPVRFDVLAIQALPRAVTLSARFRWSSGYPRTPGALGLEPTAAYDLLLQRTVPLGLDPDDARLAPFHALDLRAGKTFAFRRWALEASLDLQNVYDRRVVEPVITGFGESRPTYGFGLPVLPVFALDGRFWPGPAPGSSRRSTPVPQPG